MKRLTNSNEFFDLLSQMGGGKFVTIGYVTASNLNIPQVKRKNPETNRMKNYDDYETFSKNLGFENEISGIIKLTSYTFPWRNPDSVKQNYRKYKDDFDKLRGEFGLEPTQRKGYTSKQDYGNNGIIVYSGNNDELNGNTYTPQNMFNAKTNSSYYAIGNSGNIEREVSKNELLQYFKGKQDLSGVSALRKMGVEDEKIKEYIRREQELGMRYKNFEHKSILYMVATINGEKIVYINDNLTQSVRNVNVNPQEFIQIAKEKYKEDITMNESINMNKKQIIKLTESQLRNMISESVKNVLKEDNSWKSCVDLADEIMNAIGPEQLCYRLMYRMINHVQERGLMEILEYIYNTEVSPDYTSEEE